MSRRTAWILGTITVMLLICSLLAWLVDSVVQIDDDMDLLMVLLAGVSVLTGLISRRLYRKGQKKRQAHEKQALTAGRGKHL